jgi:transglutaminase-like putative cysteine protease
MTPKTVSRRDLVQASSMSLLLAALPKTALADDPVARRFDPTPDGWRRFEVVTTVRLRQAQGSAMVWLPVPSLDARWQRSLGDSWTGNARAVRVMSDGRLGTKVLVAEFDADAAPPTLQLTSRVETMNRAVDWKAKDAAQADPAELRLWTEPSALVPTDGIVREVASQITEGAQGDREKAQRIYDWVVVSAYREPKVRGCGVGDIKVMLETGNLGGKCADINALFVGLCRASGVPARDIYGIRLAPSAFGYRELGGNPASLNGAQHCRSEVYLRGHGWVAMDPADVDKVMRQETAEWIKDAGHPLVAPVRRALFGGWEGNWMGYNVASDVALPGARQGKLGFLMYPQGESAAGIVDSLDADAFAYTIAAREIKV